MQLLNDSLLRNSTEYNNTPKPQISYDVIQSPYSNPQPSPPYQSPISSPISSPYGTSNQPSESIRAPYDAQNTPLPYVRAPYDTQESIIHQNNPIPVPIPVHSPPPPISVWGDSFNNNTQPPTSSNNMKTFEEIGLAKDGKFIPPSSPLPLPSQTNPFSQEPSINLTKPPISNSNVDFSVKNDFQAYPEYVLHPLLLSLHQSHPISIPDLNVALNIAEEAKNEDRLKHYQHALDLYTECIERFFLLYNTCK